MPWVIGFVGIAHSDKFFLVTEETHQEDRLIVDAFGHVAIIGTDKRVAENTKIIISDEITKSFFLCTFATIEKEEFYATH